MSEHRSFAPRAPIERTSRIFRRAIWFLNLFPVALALLLGLIESLILIMYVLNSDAYVFGTEVAGVRHLSAAHYVGIGVAVLIGTVLVVLVEFARWPAGVRLAARSLVIAGMIWTWTLSEAH